ncbi:MAG: 50S ribosomal protein L10 [Gemmataceae bacterium]
MAKRIKQMEIDALKSAFTDVRDMVLLSYTGMDSVADNQMRTELRKKNVRLKLVKNSLARRVLGDLGVDAGAVWDGPTYVAWGSNSLAELSRTLDGLAKKSLKVKIQMKGAVIEGQPISFDKALTMPTREEAIAKVVMLAISPARRIAAQLQAAGGRLASQIKELAKKGEEAPAEAAAS